MKWRLSFLVALMLCLSLVIVVACGDDDDDDDDNDDAGSYDCTDACGAIYGCDYVLYADDYELSEAECVQGCNDEGGVGSCEAGCLDAFADDADCDALVACAEGCMG